MADAAFALEDPSTENFGQDVVVRTGSARRAQPAPPIGPDNATGAAPQGAPSPQPAGISFDDFFGTKTAKAPQPANDQSAPKASHAAPASPQGISFDDFFKPSPGAGPLTNTGDESYLSGLGKGAATAAIKGAADIPGFGGNLSDLVGYLVARGEHAITGEDLDTILARHAQNEAAIDQRRFIPQPPSGAQIAAPVLAKTGEYEPETEWGKIGQAGLEGAISAFGPGGVASKTGAAIPGALSIAAKQAPAVAASTGVGQGVTDVTGDPLLGAGAGLLGGAGLTAGSSAASKVARPMVAALPGRIGSDVAERMAGEQLASAASNPQAVRDMLNGTGPQTETPVVPGSKPTLGQLSGDMGILQKERAARTEDVTPFNEREAEQNAARRAQIAGLALASADVMRAPQSFRDRLNAVDQASQQAINILTQRAQTAAGALGKGAMPEQRGSSIRTAVEAARKVARDMKTRLYDAVDPEDKLNLVASPVREAGENLAKSLDPLDEQPEGSEAKIIADVRSLPDVLPFKSLRALDKRITTAMKVARRAGEDTVHRRLSILKGAVQDAIDNGVENQVAYERAAVDRGELKPEDTIEARAGQSLEEERDQFLAERRAIARGGGTGDGAGVAGRPPSAPSGNGAVGASGGRNPPNARSEALPGEALSPNFDQAAAGRLAAAKGFYKSEYAPTFKEGPVAQVLAGPFSGKYNVMDSAVPSKAVLKGDKGYETARAFIKASNGAPEAVGAIADHVVDDLRDSLLPIGVVSPSKFAKWKADYAPALRAIDEQVPGFSKRFEDAAKATDAMMEAGRIREEALDGFQKSEAGKFLGALGKNEPVEVENAVGKILTDKAAGPTRMEALVKAASHDPEALAGLKKAGIDWMLRQFSTTAEAGTSGEKLLSSAQFQKFISENRATLQKLYGSDGLGMMAAVAHDLERANRPISATRIGGSPGTAHDVAPIISDKVKSAAGHTSMMVALIEGVHLGYEHGGLKGAALAGAGGAASYLLGTLRHAGMNKVNTLVRDALLNPERARVYLSKVPASADSSRFTGLASAIRRQLIGMPINLQNQQDEKRRAR